MHLEVDLPIVAYCTDHGRLGQNAEYIFTNFMSKTLPIPAIEAVQANR
jgi:hypothetical protein